MVSPTRSFIPRPFSAVVFDMDGTLLDTEMVFKEIVYGVCEGLGFEMTADIHLAMVGSSNEVSNRLLTEAYGVSFPFALFDQHCRAQMHERMAEMVPVKTGVHELLAELAARRIPTAVAIGYVRLTTSARVMTTPLDAVTSIGVVTDWYRRPNVTAPEPTSRHFDVLAELLLERFGWDVDMRPDVP